jgi:ABC-type polysaccharide/polyol phosphate transport system ATPase subunit
VWKRHRRWLRRPQSVKEALIHKLQRRRSDYQEFWAVRDLSMTVGRGETLGICGENGAGKSTLLKMIAGVLAPTHGEIVVRGRLSAVLELGAGFLGELTGRENAVLNGAILGLDEADMHERMDSILEFADLGDFVDSPVKTYSTGMYMRLGFAIASHVDAEILLFDEVLAVGDAAFQQKCAAWLRSLADSGTTVIVVSHDLQALATLCGRLALMENGELVTAGAPDDVLRLYGERMARRGALATEQPTP